MSSEAIIGAFAALSALVTAVFAGLVSLRHARRVVATADVLELRAYRDAWLWAVRTIYKLMALPCVDNTEAIRTELEERQASIDTAAETKKELA